MAYLLSEAMLSFVGRAYLFLCCRNKERRQRELRRRYEGSYRNAGLSLLFDLLLALAVGTVVTLIAAAVYLVAA